MEKTDFEQIESLVKLMSNSSLTSLQLKTDGINLVLKKEKEMVTAMPSVVSVPVGKEPEKETTPSAEFNNPDEVVTAPLVGTFYAAPSEGAEDRKSTRLNSSHVSISYAVSRLKK